MPLIRTNSSGNGVAATPQRRSFSSKSLAANTSKLTLSTRVASHTKLSSLGKKRNTAVEFSCITDEKSSVDLDMTFLQYCPTCDKQILASDTQVLYCSESCRRKDSLSTTPPPELKFVLRSSSILTSPTSPTSPMAFRTDPFNESPVEEQGQLQLRLTSASLPVIASKPPELHSFKQDLDPTEWKPNATSASISIPPVSAASPSFAMSELASTQAHDINKAGSANSETTVPTEQNSRPTNSRRESAAFSYLAQFHRSSSSFLSLASKRPASLKTRGSNTSASIPTTPSRRPSRPETPDMSLGQSSSVSSAASSSSSIALCTPGLQSAGSRVVSPDDGPAENEDEDEDGDTLSIDEGLMFGKQTLTTVQAIGLTAPGSAEGSLRGLLARAT